MRFIHTADWHLGRSLHGVRLLDEQRAVLQQLVAIVREQRPDVLLIAGDIYDRTTPPGDAIDLLDDTLSSILELDVPVIVIAGNHDGPQLINYGSRLFAAQSLFVYGKVLEHVQRVILHDTWGPVHFYPLPYAEPLAIRQALGDETIANHQTAVAAWSARVFAEHPHGERAIALAHLFVAGGTACDSERQLVVGGTAEVDPSGFTGFNYVALGHLHRRQTLGDGTTHYSGSPLKYSFSEAEHHKSINLVDMDADGVCKIEHIPLLPQHDVRCITGLLADVLTRAVVDPKPHDYLSVRLLDTSVLLDPIARLREVYPNVLETPRVAFLTSTGLRRTGADHRTMSVETLFADFYEQILGAAPSAEALAAFAEVVNDRRYIEQEVEA
jgi:DNA repair protein SbcD/Mre11